MALRGVGSEIAFRTSQGDAMLTGKRRCELAGRVEESGEDIDAVGVRGRKVWIG